MQLVTPIAPAMAISTVMRNLITSFQFTFMAISLLIVRYARYEILARAPRY